MTGPALDADRLTAGLDDEEPTVWIAVALYPAKRWETDAGHDPLEAVLRLCARLVDGGRCTHCSRPTMFHATLEEPFVLERPFCIIEWDPELKTYRRGCEGDALEAFPDRMVL